MCHLLPLLVFLEYLDLLRTVIVINARCHPLFNVHIDGLRDILKLKEGESLIVGTAAG